MQKRLVIPDRKTLAGVLKIFVRTGPGYGSSECTEDRLIEVDLVRPGKWSKTRHLLSRLVSELHPHVFCGQVLPLCQTPDGSNESQ